MYLYFAGPLFSAAERSFNETLARSLEELGFTVFLPQRDGVERDKEPYTRMSPDERRAAMFCLDKEAIYRSDVFLFVLDGRVPDEGAAVELGLAHAHRELAKPDRRIVGLQTDVRAAFLGGKLNPMIKKALDFVAGSERELLDYLKTFTTATSNVHEVTHQS